MSDESKSTLQYQVAPSAVTRGQFRLLLLLMLIQLVMTVQGTYAPGFVAWAKSAWAAHEQRLAARAALQKRLSVEHAAMAYTAPSTQVVWEEDPQRAAKLLSTNGYQPISIQSGGPAFFTDAIPPAACWKPTIALPQCTLFGRSDTIVFMHERRVGNQPGRLVVVLIHGATTTIQGGHRPDVAFDGAVSKSRFFDASSYAATGEGGTLVQDRAQGDWLSLQPDEDGIRMAAHWIPAERLGNPGKLSIQYQSMLRFFFGQVDPSESSHFTIGYELDDKPGIFDGWLKADGSVDLVPRQGKRVGSLWYPQAK